MAGQLIIEREVSRAEAISAPGFVGREQELVTLDHAMANGPAVVLIEGEAGIGKSALLREYLTASGAEERALVAGCPPFRQPHTLGPVAEAVRQATDGVSGLSLSALAGARGHSSPNGPANCRLYRRRHRIQLRPGTGCSGRWLNSSTACR